MIRRSGVFILIGLFLTLVHSASFAADMKSEPHVARTRSSGWDAWSAELKKQCPSHRVDRMAEGGYDEFLAAFEKTLPAKTRHRLDAMAERDPSCAGMEGFTCEMSLALRDYNELGLIKKFAAYGCRQYRCDDMGMCVSP